jgi:hypothetical protein
LAIALPTDVEVTIGTLTLPPGNYLLSASVGVAVTAGDSVQFGYCIFQSPDSGPPLFNGFIAWAIDEGGANALAGAVELIDAGEVTLACNHTAGDGSVVVNSFTLAAIGVATVSLQPLQ